MSNGDRPRGEMPLDIKKEMKKPDSEPVPDDFFRLLLETNIRFPQDTFFTAMGLQGAKYVAEGKGPNMSRYNSTRLNSEQLQTFNEARLRQHKGHNVPLKTHEHDPEMDERLQEVLAMGVHATVHYAENLCNGRGFKFFQKTGVSDEMLRQVREGGYEQGDLYKAALKPALPYLDTAVTTLDDPRVKEFVRGYKERIVKRVRAGEGVGDERREFRSLLADVFEGKLQKVFPDMDWGAAKEEIFYFVAGHAQE